MQAVILAAGRGTRMGELTEEIPKPMLMVSGKTLIEHKLDALPGVIDEVIIIIGHKGDVVSNHFGDSYGNKKITYIIQDVLDGTAGALWRAKDILRGGFIVMMGDDLYSAQDIATSAKALDWLLVVAKTEHMSAGGCVIVDALDRIISIEEGSHGGAAGRISTNLFRLDTRLFDYPMVPKSVGSNEYGLPQTVLASSKLSGVPFFATMAHSWIQITSSEDLDKADKLLS